MRDIKKEKKRNDKIKQPPHIDTSKVKHIITDTTLHTHTLCTRKRREEKTRAKGEVADEIIDQL